MANLKPVINTGDPSVYSFEYVMDSATPIIIPSGVLTISLDAYIEYMVNNNSTTPIISSFSLYS